MSLLFYISSAAAVLATFLAITRTNAVHALLYLIVSLLASALVFLSLGAAFASVLEVIIYAGAIMVLFIFVIMMLNLGGDAARREREWLTPRAWAGPALICCVLLAELLYAAATEGPALLPSSAPGPKEIGISLFGPYVLGVEVASLLLLAGLVGAYHIGRQEHSEERNAKK